MNPGAVSSRPSVDTGRGVSRAATAVDTGKPTPTKTAADAGSVQDTVQLSGAATNPLSELSTSQLEDRAFEAKDAATASMGQMYGYQAFLKAIVKKSDAPCSTRPRLPPGTTKPRGRTVRAI